MRFKWINGVWLTLYQIYHKAALEMENCKEICVKQLAPCFGILTINCTSAFRGPLCYPLTPNGRNASKKSLVDRLRCHFNPRMSIKRYGAPNLSRFLIQGLALSCPKIT